MNNTNTNQNAAREAGQIQALEYAAELIRIARRYFPKSIRNSDTFQLESTCAAIGKALHSATEGSR